MKKFSKPTTYKNISNKKSNKTIQMNQLINLKVEFKNLFKSYKLNQKSKLILMLN